MKKFAAIVCMLLVFQGVLQAQRIKDIAYFRGVNSEQLIGYGLVIGLSGTGDSHRSPFSYQSVVSMLKRFGVTVPEEQIRLRNVAAVMVTATVNNMLKPGGEFDVNVSSLGDAKSLLGGQLLMTPLSSGKTGDLIGYAQGSVSVGGYDISTSTGGRVIKNQALNGRVPSGGILEIEIPGGQISTDQLSIYLRRPDYTTANNVATAINNAIAPNTAIALDGSEIQVTVPANAQANITAFLAQLESITVIPDAVARVVLNERTGTIVAGTNVQILPVTISHGSLKISIKSYPIISQPTPFTQGETVLFNNLVPYVETKDSNHVVTIDGATNVQEVAAALNSLKVSPRDIIAIFQAIKEAGALPAELILM